MKMNEYNMTHLIYVGINATMTGEMSTKVGGNKKYQEIEKIMGITNYKQYLNQYNEQDGKKIPIMSVDITATVERNKMNKLNEQESDMLDIAFVSKMKSLSKSLNRIVDIQEYEIEDIPIIPPTQKYFKYLPF